MTIDSKSKLATCNVTSDCRYLNSDGSVTNQECTCGLNPTGQSYCPIAVGESK